MIKLIHARYLLSFYECICNSIDMIQMRFEIVRLFEAADIELKHEDAFDANLIIYTYMLVTKI